MSGANDEAIHNTESRFKDSIAKFNVANIMDCHSPKGLRNDKVAKHNDNLTRHCERSEAIYNLAKSGLNNGILKGEILSYGFALKRVNLLPQMHATKTFKASHNDEVGSARDSIAKFNVANIIDCHDSANAESRNDENSTTASLRESETSEAIHNSINQKIFNGEILNYRLPRSLTTSRNDAVVGRNDNLTRHCERSEAIHNTAQKRFHSRTSLLTASLLGILASGAMVSDANAKWTYQGVDITSSGVPTNNPKLKLDNNTISPSNGNTATIDEAIKGGDTNPTTIQGNITSKFKVLNVGEKSGDITNEGKLTTEGQNEPAVYINADIGNFTNKGEITATNGSGIQVTDGKSVTSITISKGASITAKGYNNGIDLNGSAKVTGDIQVDGTIDAGRRGISFGQYSTVGNINVGEKGKILAGTNGILVGGGDYNGNAKVVGNIKVQGLVYGGDGGILLQRATQADKIEVNGGKVVGGAGNEGGIVLYSGAKVGEIAITNGAIVGVLKDGITPNTDGSNITKENIKTTASGTYGGGILIGGTIGGVNANAITEVTKITIDKGSYVGTLVNEGKTGSIEVDGATLPTLINRPAGHHSASGSQQIGNISLKNTTGETKIDNQTTITGGITLDNSKASYEGKGEILGEGGDHFTLSGGANLKVNEIFVKEPIRVNNSNSTADFKGANIYLDSNFKGCKDHFTCFIQGNTTYDDSTKLEYADGSGADLTMKGGYIFATPNALATGAVQAATSTISTNNLRNATITNIVTNALTDMQNVFNHSTTFYQAELGTKVASVAGTENIAQDIVDSNTLYDKDKGLFLIPYYSKQKIDSADTKADGNIEGFLAGYNGATLDALFYSLFLGYDRTTTDVESMKVVGRSVGTPSLDIDADSFYGGFQVAKYLKNLGDSSELYFSVNGMLGTTSADIDRYQADNGKYMDSANARSYFWNLGADIFVNYLAGKNIITPKVGISYQGDANKKYELEKSDTKVFHSYNHLYRTRASVAWSRAWTPKLSSTAELGVKYLFNPDIDTEFSQNGKRATYTHELDRFESYLNLGLSYLIRNAFILSLMYYGNYSSDITGHTGYVRLNYLF